MAAGRATGDGCPRRVGPYGLVSQLATGTLANLYLARPRAADALETKLVIKTLQARFARQRRLGRMFLNEGRLAAKLDHPSIVRVLDVGEAKGEKFIAMEYIPGGTLADVIKRSVEVGRFLPLEHALHVVGQVADGLDYAHRHRDARGRTLPIVHGNLSLSNIMVGQDGHAKLIAFGNAQVRAQIPRESTIRPAQARYLSPEQVTGESVDHRSDIYSLGVVLYETTVAQPLWRGSTRDIESWIVSRPIQPPTAVRRNYPRTLEPIVMRALARRPEDRYQSADELRRDVQEFVSAAGLRSGADRFAPYLHDIFSSLVASGSGGATAPRPPSDTEAARPAAAGEAAATPASRAAPAAARSAPSTALVLAAQPRGSAAVRRRTLVTVAVVAAVVALGVVTRPSNRASRKPGGARPGSAFASVPTPEARVGRSVSVPLPLALRSTPPAADHLTEVNEALPLPLLAVQATSASTPTASDADRPRRRRKRALAPSVSPPSAELSDKPATERAVSLPAARRPQLAARETPAARVAAPAPSRRPPEMTEPQLGPATEAAVLDQKAVAAVVRDHSSEVQSCFDRALMEQPDLHGRLSLRATIGPDGGVIDVSPSAPAMTGGGRLQECVTRAFRRWTFAPSPAGGNRSLRYSFKFE